MEEPVQPPQDRAEPLGEILFLIPQIEPQYKPQMVAVLAVLNLVVVLQTEAVAVAVVVLLQRERVHKVATVVPELPVR